MSLLHVDRDGLEPVAANVLASRWRYLGGRPVRVHQSSGAHSPEHALMQRAAIRW